MSRIDQLASILQRLNVGEDPAKVKQEAQEFLSKLEPGELAQAEQSLVEAGMAPEDLRHLCSVHMEMVKDQLERMKQQLPAGHVLETLVAEHEMILQFLDELETTNQAIQAMTRYEEKAPEFVRLKHLAQHLVGAEKHHQREEEVLFPEVERRGLSGPPHIMKLEHEQLRVHKHKLLELSQNVGDMDFREFQKQLDAAARTIVLTLRDHIFKENNILYPAAWEMITEEALWRKMRQLCDQIGYCCFTPQLQKQSS